VIEVLPPEVEKKGLDAFERIGEDVCETVERRPASVVVARVVRPKFVAKDRERDAETRVFVAEPLALPIPRGLAGPGMLADTIVKRWQDHLPLNRLEDIYARDGLDLARSTICGWHGALADVVKPLVGAMREDAFKQPYLCTDATGVLVQQKERCRTGHFWVLVAPRRHVLFEFTHDHSSDAVDEVLAGYKGFLVADAHVVYDHLYASGDVVEVNCWAHYPEPIVIRPSAPTDFPAQDGTAGGPQIRTSVTDQREERRGTRSDLTSGAIVAQDFA
jgi:transposase